MVDTEVTAALVSRPNQAEPVRPTYLAPSRKTRWMPVHPVTRRQRSVPHGSDLLEMVVLVNERNTEENPMTMTPTDEITEDNFSSAP